jgi:signal transduction histidine kinase
MNTGSVWPRPALADLVEAHHSDILRRYEDHLSAAESPLLLDPATRDGVLRQASSIVTDLVGALRAPQTVLDDVRGLQLSRQIGVSRAAERLHPAESLLAAAKLIQAILDTIAAVLPPVERPGRRGSQKIVSALSELHVLVVEIVFVRLRAAAGAYVGHLIEQIRVGNEQERLRISRELHDRVGYALTLALRQIEIAEMNLGTDPDRTSQLLEQALDRVSDAADITRQLLAGLRLGPNVVPLAGSLRAEIGELSAAAVNSEIVVRGDETWLPDEVRGEVFLILREAIRNALLHSDPEHLTVEVDVAPDELRATVEDDGSGFELRSGSPAPVSLGTGIRSMHERAAGLGGRLRISSAPDNGTRLELVVSLTPAGTGGSR